jgi:hypothetical protein
MKKHDSFLRIDSDIYITHNRIVCWVFLQCDSGKHYEHCFFTRDMMMM